MMKKKAMGFVVALLCFSCMLFCSCRHKNQEKEQTSDKFIFFRDCGTYGEKFVVYPGQGGDSRELFFDVSTKKVRPFCFDPGCEHKEAIYDENGNKLSSGCPSYDYTGMPVFLSGEYLYFFMSRCLYQADRQGNNRKKLAELTKPYEINSTACYYTDEALYVSYRLPYEYSLTENGSKEWVAGALKEKPETGVLRIPFSGGSEEVVFHSDEFYEMQIPELWYYEGKVLFLVLSKDRPTVMWDGNEEDWLEQIKEERKHTFWELYDFTISSGEVKRICGPDYQADPYFFSEVYGIERESGILDLYRYSGERITSTEIAVDPSVISDCNIIGWDKETTEGVMISEQTGEVIKRSSLTWNDIVLTVAVGDSFYGAVNDGNSWVYAYISSKDFWEGNKEKIILFQE